MSIRCGCTAEGDEIVFGPAHQCVLPERTAMPGERLPPLPRCAYPPGAVLLPEPRYMETLDESERRDH